MKLFRSKLFWFTVAVVVVCCALMIYSAAQKDPSFLGNAVGVVVTPLQNGVSHVSDGISDFFGYFYRYDALQAENEALKEQIQAYQKLETSYYSAIDENSALRDAAGIRRKHSDLELEMCSVVAVTGSGFQSMLTISRGSQAGIEAGDCVITGDGVVGVVSEVGVNYASVVGILNTDFSASAVIGRTQEVVAVGGDFDLAAEGSLKISYLENDADIRTGDAVVTNGGAYPPDLMLGWVRAFQVESHGICSYAAVTPAVDLSQVSVVFVVKSFAYED